MNKALLVVTLAALSISACTKKPSSILPPPEIDTVYVDNTPLPTDTSLTIAGISDIRTTSWSTFTLPLTVSRNIGLEQKVTMTISGLPANVKAKWSAITGYTTFNTNLELDVMFATPGTYPLIINSKTEKGKSMDYTVNLIIDTFTDRESLNMFYNSLASTALYTKDTTLDSVVYMATTLINSTNDQQLFLRNMVFAFNTLTNRYYISYNPINGNNHVKLSVNTNKGTITVAEQTVLGRTISGGLIDTFMVSGTGNIDIEKGRYDIMYQTSRDSSGTMLNYYYHSYGTLQD